MSDWKENILTVRLTQEQVMESLSCSVCRDDFLVLECVSKLACDHFFHTHCILQWLEHQNNCPICRRDFQVNANSEEENWFDVEEENVLNIPTNLSSEELDYEEEFMEEPVSDAVDVITIPSSEEIFLDYEEEFLDELVPEAVDVITIPSSEEIFDDKEKFLEDL